MREVSRIRQARELVAQATESAALVGAYQNAAMARGHTVAALTHTIAALELLMELLEELEDPEPPARMGELEAAGGATPQEQEAARAHDAAVWDAGYQRAVDNEHGTGDLDGSNPYE